MLRKAIERATSGVSSAQLAQESTRIKGQLRDTLQQATGTPDQRSQWWKVRWRGLPLYVRPMLYFIYRYCFRLGFLDGKQGFLFHFLQAFWYRLLVDVNLEELRRTPADVAQSAPSETEPRALKTT